MWCPILLGLFYAAIYVGNGASTPYMPVWFHHRGLTGGQIGLILSAPMLARMVTAPLLGLWADSFKLRRTSLMLMGLATAGCYALMAPPLGFWGWFTLWLVAGSLFAAMPPLTDVIILNRARLEGFNYGWPQGMGSVAFILANIAMGAILTRHSPELVLVWMVGAALLAATGARLLLPADPVASEGGHANASDRRAGLMDLIRDPDFMLVVVSAGLIQSAHAFYYGFASLSWKAQGVPETLTGWLWAAGVIVEVVFLWFMEPWRRQMGPRNLLVLGGVAGLIRWTA
ncbi:MAG: MFS transporter, partial [Phenylobacterium zucineum]